MCPVELSTLILIGISTRAYDMLHETHFFFPPQCCGRGRPHPEGTGGVQGGGGNVRHHPFRSSHVAHTARKPRSGARQPSEGNAGSVTANNLGDSRAPPVGASQGQCFGV